MAVLTFSSAKGGVGKTTLAVNIAGEFARRGLDTTVIDCDLNQHATQFGAAFKELNPEIPLHFIGGVNKNSIIQSLKAASSTSDIVIIDLPAGTSELSLRAIIKSHLVIIPSQKTTLDAKDALRTAFQISEASELSATEIASVLVWSMVGSRYETGTEKFVRSEMLGMLTEPERAIMPVSFLRYDAFPSGFVHGLLPYQMSAHAGRTMPHPRGDGSAGVIRVPTSAAKAAENIVAITNDIYERLNMLVANLPPGKVMLTPAVTEQIRKQMS